MSDVGNVHSNEVEGELDGVMRTLVAAAGRMGEDLSRQLEERARRAEAESVQRARETAAQYEQERAMARAQVQPIQEPAWWDRASAEDVAQAYETTSAWKDQDPDLAQAHARMGDELRERYGINVDDIGADPQRVAEVLNARTTNMQDPTAEASTEQERRDADRLLNAADQHDQNAEAARAGAERAPGVGGEAGAGYGGFEEFPEPVRHDPNAERTITLTLNEYEAERIDTFLAGTEWRARQGLDENDVDAEDPRSLGRIEADRGALLESTVGMRERLAEARPMTPESTAAIEPNVGVGPNGEVGAGFREFDEPVRHDPNAERTITLPLNDYEADRIEKFAANSIIPSNRDTAEVTKEGRDRSDNAVGIRDRLAKARTAAAESTAGKEQVAGAQDRTAGLSAWDNADRRDSHAEKMAAAGVDPVAVQAQYGADVSNAKHPRSAIATTRGAAKARKTASRAIGAQRERGERGR
jgi:hypothetical protein